MWQREQWNWALKYSMWEQKLGIAMGLAERNLNRAESPEWLNVGKSSDSW